MALHRFVVGSKIRPVGSPTSSKAWPPATSTRPSGSTAWAEQKKQLEAQVLEHANIKMQEFKQRIGRRVNEITRDLQSRKSVPDGSTATAVLNTRLHEVLDLLAEEGLPIRERN